MPLPAKLPASSSKTLSSVSVEKTDVLANRYFIQTTLGSGNCGTALLVLDRKNKDGKEKLKVAKKVFVGNLQPNETVDASNEANLLRHLDHPAIVKFYDSFVEADFFYIITEYCEGRDLDQRITECRESGSVFTEAQISEWIIEILLALQYMHNRKILHRDLKTRNIYLRSDRVKVGDFGISRILLGTLDLAVTFTGTPYYMSPEVLKHEGYNSKSDVWSAGCILFELAALKRPFDGLSLMDVMYKVTEVDPPSWPAAYAADLAALFTRMVEKDPVKRPSANDALRFPVVLRQIETLKLTIMEKRGFQDRQDVVHRDVEKITSAVSKTLKMDELQQESNLKRYQYLSPRERYRLLKQLKADEEAERIKSSILVQKQETNVKMAHARERNDPYKSTIALGSEPADDNRSKTLVATDVSLSSPRVQQFSFDEYDDEELFDDDQSQSVMTGNSRHHDNVPPHYGRSLTSSAADDEELLQMMDNLEDCLTLDDQTLVADDKEADAFGPVAKELKIKNLRTEAVKNLGQEKFEAVYNYLKKARFDDRKLGKDVDEKQVMHDLHRICSSSDLCFIVEQLLFLEMSDRS